MSTYTEDKKKHQLFGKAVIDTAEIGEYQFVQTQTCWHIYIDGNSIGYSADTLDMALIIAIAHKYDGLNSQAAHYFARMIGMEKTG